MRLAYAVPAVLIAAACGPAIDSSTQSRAVNPAVAGFQNRIQQYMDLRQKATAIVTEAEPTSDVARLRAREAALAAGIRSLRANAKHGDIFTPSISEHFRRLLRPDLKGAQGEAIRDLLRQGAPSPGAVPIEVNAKYPAGTPYPTMAPALLETLPPLPKGLEYRIVGRDLILLDQPADVILDFIRNAIPAAPR
jgi:hypothetical protein